VTSSAALLREHLQNAYDDLSKPGPRVLLPGPQRFGPREGHFHLRAEMHLQREAATQFRFGDETLTLQPGQILLVPARVFHAETIVPSALTGDQPFCNLVLNADESSLSCHLAEASSKGVPQIAYPEHREGPACRQVASWLEDSVNVARSVGGAVILDLVRAVLGRTLQLLDEPPVAGEREPLPVVRCRQMIHEELGNPELSVTLLAHRLGCNPDYLSHLFRRVRGERLSEYIDERRLLRAAELLQTTSGTVPLSCKEVAWASGFANQSYFIQRFKRRFGRVPLEYRASVSR